MTYDFNRIEAKWQKYWKENKTFQVKNPDSPSSGGGQGEAEPYYVLDMFPYPSGAGLHVGHPLGYIASDIVARYKRHQGYNVLHPMGYDSFGLPAEQYAIQTGQHPASTTEINIGGCFDENGDILKKYLNEDGSIKKAALIDKALPTNINQENYQDNIIKGYQKQLDKIGFSFDWSREVRTSDPDYYKWTQWIFIQLFESWYDKTYDKARPISELKAIFSTEGNSTLNAACDDDTTSFSAEEWKNFSEIQQQEILLKYRLTYLAETEVNWCPELGTVLANDEIVNGVSERGGHPVERKKMKQWSMRISAYAERLLQGLENLDWPESLKETQRNWIGKSVGAQISFPILSFPEGEEKAEVKNDAQNVQPKYMTGGNNSHLLIKKAQENRNNPTEAERALWSQLRNKNLDHKFRQQHLIDDFIVDFVCLRQKLIVEVDGGIHETTKEYDEERTKILNEKGFKVIRFKNEEVIGNMDSVLEKISNELEAVSDGRVFPQGKMSESEVLPLGEDLGGAFISVFTTRPDTIFGVTFMTLAPEHELVSKITTSEQKEVVEKYVKETAKRSERERMADVKTISGVFTGAYAEHPFTKEPIPIWIGDYVLANYGTGAVMAVPCGDQRDYDFAKHFEIPIKNIFEGIDISKEAFAEKDNTKLTNSDFLNGLTYKKAVKRIIFELEKIGQGEGKTNYRLRDAVFSRQRYWGEPFPVYYKDGMPQMLPEDCLPLKLPEVEKYLPTKEGEPPLGRATKWHWDEKNGKVIAVEDGKKPPSGVWGIELNTMPGWAGSSWYFFRYMESENRAETFASKEAMNYWKNVDLYIGGSEHATGHLLYARFWTKFLKDRNLAPVEEPFKKLINQGMILGESAFVYRLKFINISESLDSLVDELEFSKSEINSMDEFIKNYNFKIFVSKNLCKTLIHKDAEFGSGQLEIGSQFPLVEKVLLKKFVGIEHLLQGISINVQKIHADVSLVNTSNELDIEGFKNWRPEFKDATFILENGKIYEANSPSSGGGKGEDGIFLVKREVEKMSKSKYNVVNPDDICEEYGADTLRLYEMFLGPIDQAKPWNTAGISGVHNFLKKLYKLFHQGKNNSFYVNDPPPSEGLGEDLKTLHKTIQKVTEDIENFSFNTSISAFMICVNELTAQKCNSREVLEPLAVLVSPFAPHIAEELWEKLGHTKSVSTAEYPVFDEKYVKETSKTYPISFNGKTRFTLDLSLELSKEDIEKTVMADERTQKQLNGRTPKKVIIVPGRIVNIVG